MDCIYIYFSRRSLPTPGNLLYFRQVFDYFNDACSRALQCGPELCIDETLYANRGRGFSFKQFNPLKPSKYGFLYKSLGDSIYAYIYRLGCSVLSSSKPILSTKNPVVKPFFIFFSKKLHLFIIIKDPHLCWPPH
jgi:hypothetical protein